MFLGLFVTLSVQAKTPAPHVSIENVLEVLGAGRNENGELWMLVSVEEINHHKTFNASIETVVTEGIAVVPKIKAYNFRWDSEGAIDAPRAKFIRELGNRRLIVLEFGQTPEIDSSTTVNVEVKMMHHNEDAGWRTEDGSLPVVAQVRSFRVSNVPLEVILRFDCSTWTHLLPQ